MTLDPQTWATLDEIIKKGEAKNDGRAVDVLAGHWRLTSSAFRGETQEQIERDIQEKIDKVLDEGYEQLKNKLREAVQAELETAIMKYEQSNIKPPAPPPPTRLTQPVLPEPVGYEPVVERMMNYWRTVKRGDKQEILRSKHHVAYQVKKYMSGQDNGHKSGALEELEVELTKIAKGWNFDEAAFISEFRSIYEQADQIIADAQAKMKVK